MLHAEWQHLNFYPNATDNECQQNYRATALILIHSSLHFCCKAGKQPSSIRAKLTVQDSNEDKMCHSFTFIRSSAALSRYCQSIHVPLFFITLSSMRDLILASVCSSSFRLFAWFSHCRGYSRFNLYSAVSGTAMEWTYWVDM